jgi:hypothetical protein
MYVQEKRVRVSGWVSELVNVEVVVALLTG